MVVLGRGRNETLIAVSCRSLSSVGNLLTSTVRMATGVTPITEMMRTKLTDSRPRTRVLRLTDTETTRLGQCYVSKVRVGEGKDQGQGAGQEVRARRARACPVCLSACLCVCPFVCCVCVMYMSTCVSVWVCLCVYLAVLYAVCCMVCSACSI